MKEDKEQSGFGGRMSDLRGIKITRAKDNSDMAEYAVPEGWSANPSFSETVGPKIKKKDHLSGNQDKSKMLEEEIGDDMDMSEEEYAYWCECKEKMEEEEADYADDGKKYTHTYTDKKGKKRKARYGAKGYSIAPGTKRGDSYCARSYGDMKSHNKDCSGKDRNTPICLSRKKWKCKGKSSSKGCYVTPFCCIINLV